MPVVAGLGTLALDQIEAENREETKDTCLLDRGSTFGEGLRA
jgi:hypothetical protein